MYVWMYIERSVYMYIERYACMYVCANACMFMRIHREIYMYACTQRYTDKYTDTQINTPSKHQPCNKCMYKHI